MKEVQIPMVKKNTTIGIKSEVVVEMEIDNIGICQLSKEVIQK